MNTNLNGTINKPIFNDIAVRHNDLEILPVINKIDLPSARVDEVKKEIELGE